MLESNIQPGFEASTENVLVSVKLNNGLSDLLNIIIIETNLLFIIFNQNVENRREQTAVEEVSNKNQNAKKGKRKRKAATEEVINENQIGERWSDEETDLLLNYIEENYDQYQQGKKSEFYNTVSSKIITSKSPESIKGRLRRLLDKYEKVKQLNNKTGSGRTKWKWLEKMERIFGCRENVSPSFVSNIFTNYFSDEEKEVNIEKEEKESKKVVKKAKNNIESLVEIMSNISQSKVKISEQRLKLEQEKMERDHKLQIEKLEVEKQKWKYE